MNKALLSIGTNEDRDSNISLCHKLLGNIFHEIHYSKTSITTPYGSNYKNDFLNQLAIVYTDKEKDDVLHLLKCMEKEMGRKPADKEMGIVKIDIDLIIWNDEVLKPSEISRSYIAGLLSSIKY